MNVIMQSTQDRINEIQSIYQDIKPLLDKGYSYKAAITMKCPDVGLYTSKYKEIIKYCKTQGYDNHYQPLFTLQSKSRYGIKRVGLERHNEYLTNVPSVCKGFLPDKILDHYDYITGYYWRYQYMNVVIGSRDLISLRHKVEKRGFQWIVDDLTKARESYDYNRRMQKNKMKNFGNHSKYNTTGVYRVHKAKADRMKQGYIWVYAYYNPSTCKRSRISNVDINTLKEKVESKGLPWKILDLEKAKDTGLKI